MSKSLGNLVMVADLLKDWTPDALRLYLAQHHYRKSWSHDLDELEQAAQLADTLRSAAQAEGGGGGSVDPQPYRDAFIEAMDDDIDSPAALSHLEGLARAILEGAQRGRKLSDAQAALRSLAGVFGLRLDAQRPEDRVSTSWRLCLEDFT